MSETPHDTGGGDKLMAHDYDGIREYDNPTPGWWHAIFIGCCLFSLVYYAAFHMSPIGDRWGVHGRYGTAAKAAEELAMQQLGVLAADDASLMRLSIKELAVAKGKAIFAAKCIACHGPNAGGMPSLGLNLTDNAGKNIKTPADVFTTIANGVPNTAMVPNMPAISKDDCILAAAYVVSLRGTNTPDGLPPEGEEMPAWPVPAGE